MINKADRLVYNQTTNQAERYMALVAKCTGGKRVNYSKSISYTARAYAAAISHACGPAWHLKAWRGTLGKIMGKVMAIKHQKHINRANKVAPKKRIKNKTGGPDCHYGPDAAQPDISETDMTSRKNLFLQKLNDRICTYKDIEQNTKGQHDNSLWRELRQDYLTASNFGIVIKRKKSTHCHNFIKNLLYRKKELNTEGILYGRINEKKAIMKYEEITGAKVDKCGFFIDLNHPFLGATPDGLIGENGLIEVKCLKSIKGKLVDSKVRHCYSITNNDINLKHNHNYFYQIQGQLNITNRNFCDFVIYTDDDFHIERINIELWNNFMLPKLTSFYMDCILPEILDGRIPRGLKVRDPTKDT